MENAPNRCAVPPVMLERPAVSMSPLELLIPALLVAATLVIAWLCYSWMKSTRASQARAEQMQQQLISLMEEQNALLRQLGDKK